MQKSWIRAEKKLLPSSQGSLATVAIQKYLLRHCHNSGLPRSRWSLAMTDKIRKMVYYNATLTKKHGWWLNGVAKTGIQ